MKLHEKFIKEFDRYGGNEIITGNIGDSELVSFGVNSDEGIPYGMTFLFKRNNKVEICVFKPVETKDLLQTLMKINNLNSTFLGITFFLNGEFLCASLFCDSQGNVEKVTGAMAAILEMAESAFPRFKSPKDYEERLKAKLECMS